MQEFHLKNNITNYVLMLMSIASNIFSDASIGNLINLAVVDIILLEEDLNVKSLYSGNFCLKTSCTVLYIKSISRVILLDVGKYANYMLWNFIDHMKNKKKN